MKSIIKQMLNKWGVDIGRYPSPVMRALGTILKTHDINLVLDVGANDGWYSKHLRSIGYQNRIISFEPLKEPFDQVSAYAKKFGSNHMVMNCALGETDGFSIINVSQNSVSSSILKATATLNKAVSETRYVDSREIKISKLDTIFSSLSNPTHDNIFLKMDVQGYEMNVLRGAVESLQYIQGIQLETAFLELYEDEKLFKDMVPYIESLGFELYLIVPGFLDQTSGRMLEADCVFMRNVK